MKILSLSLLLWFMYPGKRQILLFYNDAGLSVKNKQLLLLNSEKKELQDRDIVVHIYKTSDEKAIAGKWKIKTDDTYTFLLIGKDGGEKIRTDTVVSLAQLYKTIDAMPMRKNEIKNR